LIITSPHNLPAWQAFSHCLVASFINGLFGAVFSTPFL
jgi:hypothetical protein